MYCSLKTRYNMFCHVILPVQLIKDDFDMKFYCPALIVIEIDNGQSGKTHWEQTIPYRPALINGFLKWNIMYKIEPGILAWCHLKA